MTVTDNEGNSGNIRFAVDENGNYGYKKVGADTVTPFKSGGSGLDGDLITSSSDISEGDTLAEGTTYIYADDLRSNPTIDIVYKVELLDINSIDFTKTTFNASETYTIIMNDAVSNLKQGDIITINNDLCNEFVVIGKNHDGTTGTVDIMSRRTVLLGKHFGYYVQATITSDTNFYPNSLIRTWINNDYLTYFYNTDVVAKFKTMDVKYAISLTAGATLQDKVKLLSCTEMNMSNRPSYTISNEGTAYTYFTAGAYDAANTSRVVYGGKYTGTNNATNYWLRTKAVTPSSYSYFYYWYIGTTGSCYYIESNTGYHTEVPPYNLYGILPVLRL